MEYCMGNDSECSSGCESGWTLYLDDNSFVSAFDNHKNGFLGKGKCGFDDEQRTEEEEEDMSMVSDASSGPPHIPEEENYYANEDTSFFHHERLDAARLNITKTMAKKQGLRENKRRNLHEESPLLDDTASSHVFNFPNNKSRLSNNHQHASAEALLDVSKGYSTTQFEGSSAYNYHQSQYGFLQYPSLSGNYLQQNQWFGGRTWQQ